MSYFEEKLPSNGKSIQCKEYTINDAKVICSMNPKLSERLTSKFLSIIQTGQDIIDPVKQMTVQDRKTLLFKYALVSLEDEAIIEQSDYIIAECRHCGKDHKFFLSLDEFRKTAKNKIISSAEILTEFNSQRLKITPLMGEHAEQLEMLNNQLDAIKTKHGEDSEECYSQRATIRFHKMLCQFTLVVEGEKELSEKEIAKRDHNWFYSLPYKQFNKLENLINSKQDEIFHGIDFTHNFTCPEKEGAIAVELPFHFENFVPRI